MTNTKLFRDKVKVRGIKYRYLADLLGITTFGLQKKIDNITEFKASEIAKLSEALALSADERNLIFFATDGD